MAPTNLGPLHKRMEERLESLIDEAYLTFVLERLVIVCHGRARNFESNQDSKSAREWTNAGNRIDKCVSQIRI